jgi:hypothetical protein
MSEPAESTCATAHRVRIPFNCRSSLPVTIEGVTAFEFPETGSPDAADSVAAEGLWDALYLARAGKSQRSAAELEDAIFRLYLPMARAVAQRVGGDDAAERTRAEQAAEPGLAHAVLSWEQRSGGGFRRFARGKMLRHLLLR